jgi:DNA-binding SARP family transcriptional activator
MTPKERGPVTAGLQLIDGFRLWVDGTEVHIAPSTQRLLALLALHEEAMTRTAISALLWPSATPRRSASCLRSTLWRLVRPPHVLVEPIGNALQLAAGLEVDVVQARRMADGVSGGSGLPLTKLGGEILPGWPDPWLDDEREWFRQIRLRVLEAMSERYRNQGDHVRAFQAAMTAVRMDPLRESAHRLLVALHLQEGNPAAAMRQFTSYSLRLRKELGIAPSSEIRQLVQPLLGR